MKLRIKKLNDDATIPKRFHSTDAGVDLYSPIEFTLKPGEFKRIQLGIAIELPKNHVAMVQGKSGLAIKYGIDTIGNIIDEGYSGEISATLVCNGNDEFKVFIGDKIAQLLIMPISYPEIEEVDDINSGDRGDAGFGSTGK